MPRPTRYRVTQKRGELTCTLTLASGYGQYLDDCNDTTRVFWFQSSTGNVYDKTTNTGASGRPVCETLFGAGAYLITTRANFADAIRTLARRHCDAIDRENTRP